MDTVTDSGTDGLRYIHVQAKDLAGNESDPPAKASVTIDGTAPMIESITDTTATTDGNYRAGEDIELTVRFDETVKVEGTPALNFGSGRLANCTNCPSSGTRELTFSYQVVAGHNGTLTVTGLILGGGNTIADGAGNTPLTTLSLEVNNVVLDTIAPTVQNLNVGTGDDHWTWGCSESDCKYRFEFSASSTAPGSLSSTYSTVNTANLRERQMESTIFTCRPKMRRVMNQSFLPAATPSR